MGLSTPEFNTYLIRKTSANQRPNNILYIDTETKTKQEDETIKHRMKMAWACHVKRRTDRSGNTEKWTFWEKPLLLQQYIEKKATVKTTLYVIGHNVFFDLQSSDFFYYFTKQGWKLDFIYDKGLVYILSIYKDGRHIKCISSTNFFPTSLKEMGKMVGKEKLEVDFEESSDEDLKVYCKRDVEILKASMEMYLDFIDKHDLGNFMSTKSSQAFVAFRHRFMTSKIYTHRNEDISEFEKLAYFGGRAEAGHIGKVKGGPFISLDINSMYPYVMRLYEYPVKIIDFIERPNSDQLRICLNSHCVVAEAYIETDEPAYAYRKDNKILFPVGRFPVYLCTMGLEYARSHNHLIHVERLAVYEKAHIFDQYVDYFYNLKLRYEKDNNKTMRTLCKYFLNSLYGKFGQKKPLIEVEDDLTNDGYYREEIFDTVTGQKEIITKLFNKTFIEWGSQTAPNSLIAVASHVTEYARFHLYDLMKKVGLRKVLYTDTDSIKIRRRDKRPLVDYIDNEKLGSLKLEETFNQFTIYAPKDYKTENTEKIKGVPKKAEKVQDGIYRYTSFLKQDSHLRHQVTRYFITKVVRKELKREYSKGIVLKSGKVIPLKLNVSFQDRCL